MSFLKQDFLFFYLDKIVPVTFNTLENNKTELLPLNKPLSLQTRIEPEWTQESLIEDWKEQGEDEPLELVCRRTEPTGELGGSLTTQGFVVMLTSSLVLVSCSHQPRHMLVFSSLVSFNV